MTANLCASGATCLSKCISAILHFRPFHCLWWAMTGSAGPHLSGDVAERCFPRVLSSLEVTFLYENYLLELRHVAFEGKSHMREPQLL